MNWDQQLIKACTETDGTPHPHTDHVLTGAKWQRDQLKSKEAIERAAKTIHETTQFPGPQPSWEEMKKTNPDYCTYRRDLVEETINALLGDSDND